MGKAPAAEPVGRVANVLYGLNLPDERAALEEFHQQLRLPEQWLERSVKFLLSHAQGQGQDPAILSINLSQALVEVAGNLSGSPTPELATHVTRAQ
jgi:hypothetical protein